MSLTADGDEGRLRGGNESPVQTAVGNEGKWGVSQVDVAQDSNRWNKIFVI
jgi:hypothetical protein